MKKIIIGAVLIMVAMGFVLMSIVGSYNSASRIKAASNVDVEAILTSASRKFGIKNDKTELSYNSSARAMATISADSGEVIFSKNMDKQLPMASTTKIFTALAVIENIKDLEQLVTIPAAAVGIEGTSLYLEQGEQLSVKNLLYGLMLRSGNDAAVALAIHTSGSVEKFCQLMKETAIKAGATNSNFKNPHGLDAEGHYTTAYDLAVVSAYALKNQEFKEIVSTKKVTMPWETRTYDRVIMNKNRLLNSLDGCCGVKTGFTKKAGRCYVGASQRNGFTYVSVVLNCGPMFEEVNDMLNLCHNNFNQLALAPLDENVYVEDEMTYLGAVE
ncbi:MAG: D-alanyl-D-alanine carboxypeptidase [Firmicutes bacterium]|nr:D-alanyl-D-alanine carboxypeptidase [Bacillota bacterium]